MSRRRSGARVLLVPGLLALVTAGGLVLGLLADGGWDVVATLCLLAPLGGTRALWRPHGRRATGPLPARIEPAKSAPHPRDTIPPGAERA